MNDAEYFDVLIVGAGLSGIGAAHRLRTECPGKSFAVLEGRSEIGGTWDLFRYPGVRSDSDMYTLGYAFRPWQDATASIAGGQEILRYIRDTARELGIDPYIRFNHRVVSASWSSDEACWRVVSEVRESGGEGPVEHIERVEHRAKFLYLCTGYYSYDDPYQPEFAGRDRFEGDFVHPQFWPEDLDYAGKRVVVIGSGATAVTLVPAMSAEAEHVTMLQRSPTYMIALSAEDPISRFFEKHFPPRVASKLSRWKNIVLSVLFYQLCRRRPEDAKNLLLEGVRRWLPGREVDPDFVPRYEPWDQRLCLVANGDLFTAIRDGKASVVTDRIAALTESGIELETGRHLPADVIVSATGLTLVAWGGIDVDLDGAPVLPQDTLIYRGFMIGDVPNLAFALGYTNASFTLRSDLSSRTVCRLLNYMDAHGYDVATPSPDGTIPVQRAAIDLTSGYVTRALDRLPKQGSVPPWTVRQNYAIDFFAMTFGRMQRSMRFSRTPAAKAASGAHDRSPERGGNARAEAAERWKRWQTAATDRLRAARKGSQAAA